MRFRSKIDAWLLAVMLGAALAAGASILAASAQGKAPPVVVSVFVFVLTVGLPIWLLAATYYTIESDLLLVRSGPFLWRIPLQSIRSVEQSRSMLSSPALSLDRLKIEYAQGLSIYVSPKDKEGFLREISSRRSNTSLERSRDR